MIGFLSPVVKLGIPQFITGLLLGLLMNLHSPIITRVYGAISVVGIFVELIIRTVIGVLYD